MTEKSGDDDKQFFFVGKKATVQFYYETKVAKVALGNLYIQKEIEAARDQHAKLVELIESAEEHLKKADQPPAQKRSSPPAPAAFLLAWIAPKNSAQALLGDLEEMFQKNADKFGEDRAPYVLARSCTLYGTACLAVGEAHGVLNPAGRLRAFEIWPLSQRKQPDGRCQLIKLDFIGSRARFAPTRTARRSSFHAARRPRKPDAYRRLS